MKRASIAVALALCAAASGGAVAQTTSLRFSTWAGGDALALLQQLAKEYGEKNPNVNVTVEVTPFADYARKIAVQMASNDAPDVGWLAERDVPAFIASKAVVDLSRTLNAPAFKLSDYPLSTLGLWKRGGGIYGVPFSNSPQVLFYNKDLFQKAGVPDPMQQYARGTWDYASFQAASRAIKNATGVFGARVMRLDPKAWNSGTLAVLWSYGGGVYDKDFKCTLNSPASMRGFQLMHDMMFKDASMPRPGDQTTFESGRIGMYPDNISYSAQMRDVNFKWGVAPLPKGPAGRVTQLGQAGYVVFSKSSKQAQATDFLAYLSSPDVMARTARFFPPPRASVLGSNAYLSSNPMIPAASLKTSLLSQIPSARVFITDENFPKANDLITSGVERLLQPNADIKSTLDGLCRQVDGL